MVETKEETIARLAEEAKNAPPKAPSETELFYPRYIHDERCRFAIRLMQSITVNMSRQDGRDFVQSSVGGLLERQIVDFACNVSAEAFKELDQRGWTVDTVDPNADSD